MKTIILSIFGNRISPRLDVSEKVMVVKIENNEIKTKETLQLDNVDTLKKLENLLKLKPDVLICGGLTRLCVKKLKNYNIKVIPWIQGDIDYILNLYLDGLLPIINESIFN